MTSIPRIATAGLIAALSATAFAAPAQAASVGVASVTSASEVHFKAASGAQSRVVVLRTGNQITIWDEFAPLTAGKGCVADAGDKRIVLCTTAETPKRVTVWAYDLNDEIVNDSDVATTVYAGAGDDRIIGGTNRDRFFGQSGKDNIDGGGGNDSIWGGAGNDTLAGRTGDDRLFGGSGRDSLYGSEGNDILRGENGVDYLSGGDGNDRLVGGNGKDALSGGAGDDRLYGKDSRKQVADTLDGGVNGTNGDICRGTRLDSRVNCEK
ncbi:Ca2+-binding RTX toxin-like protein [Actinoplanes campanulatus]|uniref:Ca2+-binding RTX toxin-like protein n=1 Tax=Actinoplanes campanulatus TaxID=113559 RepID=A0A7W5FH53_9ACTN|nr:calcium-binding protein [Actinoplanes campanulatus]MBB3098216.1 Ca2+-binding RTX toxin-like protein [Actinoplanes campanulatus]GGN34910.1 hypothetical protein GCM10010109_58400 [Actinoplanes campanulatus]GID38826.1 hypothetical protein Aca09nite_53320 [Actinoplanes campanulatus]